MPLLATPDNAAGLFNGKDLTLWSGTDKLWSVEDGQIVGRTPGLVRNEFLRSDLLLGDFKFSVDVLLAGNEGNSGIQFRSQAQADGEVHGYQADVGPGWWGKLYEEGGRGLLSDGAGEAQIKSGDWNHYEIVAQGHKIRTSINGRPSVEPRRSAGRGSRHFGPAAPRRRYPPKCGTRISSSSCCRRSRRGAGHHRHGNSIVALRSKPLSIPGRGRVKGSSHPPSRRKPEKLHCRGRGGSQKAKMPVRMASVSSAVIFFVWTAPRARTGPDRARRSKKGKMACRCTAATGDAEGEPRRAQRTQRGHGERIRKWAEAMSRSGRGLTNLLAVVQPAICVGCSLCQATA